MNDPWQHWHKQRRDSTWREWREPYQPWRLNVAAWLDVVIIALLGIAICVRWL